MARAAGRPPRGLRPSAWLKPRLGVASARRAEQGRWKIAPSATPRWRPSSSAARRAPPSVARFRGHPKSTPQRRAHAKPERHCSLGLRGSRPARFRDGAERARAAPLRVARSTRISAARGATRGSAPCEAQRALALLRLPRDGLRRVAAATSAKGMRGTRSPRGSAMPRGRRGHRAGAAPLPGPRRESAGGLGGGGLPVVAYAPLSRRAPTARRGCVGAAAASKTAPAGRRQRRDSGEILARRPAGRRRPGGQKIAT